MTHVLEWQDISTAPTDREFLAWDCVAERYDVCELRDFHTKGKYHVISVQYDGELGPDPDEFGHREGNITLWCELPEEPAIVQP